MHPRRLMSNGFCRLNRQHWIVLAFTAGACASDKTADVLLDAGPITASNASETNCVGWKPPSMVVATSAGEHIGVTGSYCAGLPDCYRCADRDYSVSEYLTVRPGDDIVISMPEGALRSGGADCEPSCAPALHIYEECPTRRWLKQVPFREGEAWNVSLPVGRYLIAANAYFIGDDGSGGSTSSAFGIIVDEMLGRGRSEAASRPDACKSEGLEPTGDEDAGT